MSSNTGLLPKYIINTIYESELQRLKRIEKNIEEHKRLKIENQGKQEFHTSIKILICYTAFIHLLFFVSYYITLIIFPIEAWLIKKFIHWYFRRKLLPIELALDESEDQKKRFLEDFMDTQPHSEEWEKLKNNIEEHKRLKIENQGKQEFHTSIEILICYTAFIHLLFFVTINITLIIFPIEAWLIKKFIHWYFRRKLLPIELALDESEDQKKRFLEDFMDTQPHSEEWEKLKNNIEEHKRLKIENQGKQEFHTSIEILICYTAFIHLLFFVPDYITLIIFPIEAWLIKKFIHWYFRRKLLPIELALDESEDQKKRFLEDFMDTEPYHNIEILYKRIYPDRLEKLKNHLLSPETKFDKAYLVRNDPAFAASLFQLHYDKAQVHKHHRFYFFALEELEKTLPSHQPDEYKAQIHLERAKLKMLTEEHLQARVEATAALRYEPNLAAIKIIIWSEGSQNALFGWYKFYVEFHNNEDLNIICLKELVLNMVNQKAGRTFRDRQMLVYPPELHLEKVLIELSKTNDWMAMAFLMLGFFQNESNLCGAAKNCKTVEISVAPLLIQYKDSDEEWVDSLAAAIIKGGSSIEHLWDICDQPPLHTAAEIAANSGFYELLTAVSRLSSLTILNRQGFTVVKYLEEEGCFDETNPGFSLSLSSIFFERVTQYVEDGNLINALGVLELTQTLNLTDMHRNMVLNWKGKLNITLKRYPEALKDLEASLIYEFKSEKLKLCFDIVLHSTGPAAAYSFCLKSYGMYPDEDCDIWLLKQIISLSLRFKEKSEEEAFLFKHTIPQTLHLQKILVELSETNDWGIMAYVLFDCESVLCGAAKNCKTVEISVAPLLIQYKDSAKPWVDCLAADMILRGSSTEHLWDICGQPPLHTAAERAVQTGWFAFFSAVAGLSYLSIKNQQGFTVLEYLQMKGYQSNPNYKMIITIIRKIEGKPEEGDTPPVRTLPENIYLKLSDSTRKSPSEKTNNSSSSQKIPSKSPSSVKSRTDSEFVEGASKPVDPCSLLCQKLYNSSVKKQKSGSDANKIFQSLAELCQKNHKGKVHENWVSKSIDLIAEQLDHSHKLAIPACLLIMKTNMFLKIVLKLASTKKWICMYHAFESYQQKNKGNHLENFASTLTAADFLNSISFKEQVDLHGKILTCLIDNGATIVKDPRLEKTALEVCLTNKEYRAIIILLKYGLDPSLLTLSPGDTPLHAAAEIALRKDIGYFELFEYLLKLHDSDQMKYSYLDISCVDKGQQTLYHVACRIKFSKHSLRLVEILYKRGLPSDVADAAGKFPYQYISQKSSDRRNGYLVRVSSETVPTETQSSSSGSSPSSSRSSTPVKKAEPKIKSVKFEKKNLTFSIKTRLKDKIDSLQDHKCKNLHLLSFHKEDKKTKENRTYQAKEETQNNGDLNESSGSEVDESQHVDLLNSNAFENLEWEVECTSDVWKTLHNENMPYKKRKQAVFKIQQLAKGDWRSTSYRKVKDVPQTLKLYTIKLSRSSRIIWELAIAFSSRCSAVKPIPDTNNADLESSQGQVYSEVIRVWAVVFDMKDLKHVQDQIVKSHTRGENCLVQKQLESICEGKEKFGDGTKRLPRLFAQKQIDKIQLDLQRFCPPASDSDNEYHIIKFYSFSTALVSSVLQMDTSRSIDFPFQVTELEHRIINLSSTAPIILLGRSGTGKTTCCLYRLWMNFVRYWSKAELADAPLYPLNCVEMRHTEADRGEQETEIGEEEHLDDMAEEKNENLTQEFFFEDETNPDSDSCLSSDVIAKGQLFTHLHQLFVTKNSVLCSEVLKNFRELTHGCEVASKHMGVEDLPLPHKFQEITDNHFPLFLTSKKLWIVLDASLDPPYFFPRHNDGSLKCNVSGWSNEEDHLAFLPSLDDDDDADDSFALLYEFSTQQNKVADQRKEVSYEIFLQLWPEINKPHSGYHPSLLWTEIISFIKGSFEALNTTNGYLSEEQYIDIGRKRAPNFNGERDKVYKLFMRYQRQKRQRGMFDESDVVFNLYKRLQKTKQSPCPLHEIYVDETQDFTQAELCLLIQLSENPNQMFLTGDTAQSIMRGVAFRFNDLKSLFFYAEEQCASAKKPKTIHCPKSLYELSHNYRSHQGILELASSVIDILSRYFSDSFDPMEKDQGLFDGPKPKLLESCSLGNLAMLLKGNKRQTSQIEFGAHQVILVVNNESRGNLPVELSTGLVLTIFEAKGLEFDDVLLYNFFQDSQASKEWRVVTEFLQELVNKQKTNEYTTNKDNLIKINMDVFQEANRPRPLAFNSNLHKIVNSELKLLYTALTRARVNLWIFDADTNKRAPMFDYFKTLDLYEIAGMVYLRLQNPLRASWCFQRIQHFDRTVDILHDNKMYDHAIDAIQQYNLIVKSHGTKGEDVPEILLKHKPQKDINYLCYRSADSHYKDRKFDKMKSVLNQLPSVEKMEFLEKKGLIDLAAAILFKEGQVEQSIQLLRRNGKYEKGIELARGGTDEILADCLYTFAQYKFVQLKQFDVNSDLAALRKETNVLLEEAKACYQRIGDMNGYGLCLLYLSIINNDKDSAAEALTKFLLISPFPNVAGCLQSADILTELVEFEEIFHTSNIIKAIELAYKLLKDFKSTANAVSLPLREYLQHSGFRILNSQTVCAYPKLEPLVTIQLELTRNTRSSSRVDYPITEIKQKLHRRLLIVIEKLYLWVRQSFMYHLSQSIQCPLYIAGYECRGSENCRCPLQKVHLFCKRPTSGCLHRHEPYTEKAFKKAVTITTKLMVMDSELITQVDKDDLALMERLQNSLDNKNVYSISQLLFLLLTPVAGNGLAFKTPQQLCSMKKWFVSLEKCSVFVRNYLFATWERIKFHNHHVRNFFLESTVLIGLFNLNVNSKLWMNQLCESAQCSLPYRNPKNSVLIFSKNMYFCIYEHFVQSLFYLHEKWDPFRSLIKFTKYAVLLQQKNFPYLDVLLFWCEFFVVLAFMLVLKSQRDLSVVLPENYISHSFFIDCLQKNSEFSLQKAIQEAEPLGSRHIKILWDLIEKLVIPMFQYDMLKVAEKERHVTSGVTERYIVLGLVFLSNNSRGVYSDLVPQIIDSISRIDITDIMVPRLKEALQKVRIAKGSQDTVLILEELLQMRGDGIGQYNWSYNPKTQQGLQSQISIPSPETKLNSVEFGSRSDERQDFDDGEYNFDNETEDESGFTEDELNHAMEYYEKMRAVSTISRAYLAYKFHQSCSNLAEKVADCIARESGNEVDYFSDIKLSEAGCNICGVSFTTESAVPVEILLESIMTEEEHPSPIAEDIPKMSEMKKHKIKSSHKSNFILLRRCITKYRREFVPVVKKAQKLLSNYQQADLNPEIAYDFDKITKTVTELDQAIIQICKNALWGNLSFLESQLAELKNALVTANKKMLKIQVASAAKDKIESNILEDEELNDSIDAQNIVQEPRRIQSQTFYRKTRYTEKS